MAPEQARIEIPPMPEPVGALGPVPESKRREWTETYAKAFRQAQVNSPADETAQRAAAAQRANQIFEVEPPASYEEAAALAPWQVQFRGEANGKFWVITIDHKKYSFDLPAPAAIAKPADAQKPTENK